MSVNQVIDIQLECPKIIKVKNLDCEYFNGSYNDFFYQFLLSNKPCIIRNVTQDWESSSLWTVNDKPNLEYLDSHYGDVEVTVANCNEKYYNAQLKTTMRFKDFIKYWKNLIVDGYPSTKPCLYLKDWHFTKDFPHENIYRVPFQFCSDWLNEYFTSNKVWDDDYRFVYMGPRGSWTPFHVDVFTSFSWSVNLCGRKKWILLPPGEELKLKDKFGNLLYDVGFLEEDNDNHADVKFVVVYQNTGEAIFVPSGWHHQVWNLRDTISINHNWVNACNLKNMWSSMLTNFEDVKKEIEEFRNTMDEWSNHCQLLLKSCFGMNFKHFHDFLLFIQKTRSNELNSINSVRFKVYNEWVIGENHLKFDLKIVEEVLNTFLSHPDVKFYFDKYNNNNFSS